ncbi:tRNA dihydrouridine synthase DusB [Liquorilactobacillus satsumensis]|uniref:tRNA-dihydrouridine synthase n=1 Tax=Liquorilactobacillus satsumensis DSM 16230 = JCM 12392 TaxID=1423801 RepID=A0A0R1V8S0_9LACO|nr:tRNA dihydrouridine synthase DusB [Liquorilactobacillus satsumensis]KRM00020.1 tRNA-dihydrouridine synthase [Liquorilactobacillus satsumensis DSM 16230 = JCM 12392]MCC7666979.1 tRNA dihydrouridine synthase DusB [Liquorilactobacillus satsumensis]MCP9313609.1 tRNA dihydrouridine synthase DusB [Liquorilactobacillus satsumensis]MCP9329722.1 tRNA dihydrouridine synthase DusB [Liquorilactobacillus satsumensis]MCP9360725.1 tRNA dihydrouridine synthase DusB [Liquorilactobacillus satsumensis]
MEWKIGNLTIPNQIVVAPMAGVTNVAFRMICKEFGAGLVVCEMISDRGIQFRNKKTLGMLRFDPTEHPVSVQIFGGNKDTLVEAARYIEENVDVDIIDINMGCPVPKVTKAEAGARWLLDPNQVYEMVHAVTSACSKPVTVKMRTGWDEDHIYAVENALAAQEGGAAALAMHGRTRKQLYSGHADWGILKEVADHLHEIPFIGNGDVRTPEDAKKMLTDVGADAVMIGRAALGNPWIVKQASEYLAGEEVVPEPTPAEKIKVAKEHLHRLVGIKGDYVGPREFRSQAAYYLKGIPRSARAKAALNDAATEAQMITIFDNFLSDVEDYVERKKQRQLAK